MGNKKNIILAVAVIALIVAASSVVILINNAKKVYTISFDTDGGNEVISQQVEEGGKINKPADPTREGYEFLGWYLDGEYFDFESSVEKDMKLEAKWKALESQDPETPDVTKYTVTFNTDGGSAVTSQTVEGGNTASKPSDPTRTGYKFLGWYLSGTKYDFAKEVTGNITLVAKWEKVQSNASTTPTTPEKPATPAITKYTVTFNTDGGSAVASQTVESGNTATKPADPTKDGYTFIGWYYNDTVFSFGTKITSNVTIVAKWEKNAVITYKIENIADSFVGQVRVFVLKDGVKVAGTADLTLSDGTVVTNVSVPATGFITNGYDLKSVTNVKVK